MWYKLVTWIAIDPEMRADEDGTLDRSLGHDLQIGIVGVRGVEMCDGIVLYAETSDEQSPNHGGQY